ncbi:MAG: DUF2156 domain-containing protein, partial [Candidatus Omnitrophica bacterium]|nr:DUF2156 domain-containing protein [Candidatus Omnitrophota bacterium]
RNCRYVAERLSADGGLQFARAAQEELLRELQSPRGFERLRVDPRLVFDAGFYPNDIELLERLPGLRGLPDVRGLNPLSLEDRHWMQRLLREGAPRVSAYSFVSLWLWQDLYCFEWKLVQGALCLFASNGNCAFMPLPPLGGGERDLILQQCAFELEGMGAGSSARLENLLETDCRSFEALGWEVYPKGVEFLYERKDLAELHGRRYESKRNLCHQFEALEPVYAPYCGEDREAVRALYEKWVLQKKARLQDPIAAGLLEDQGIALKRALESVQELGLLGRCVRVKGELAGFSFGFELNPDVFCVLFEITDLECKGAAAFLFREFCREMEPYPWINAMDDSGLDSVTWTKRSYYPAEEIPLFNARPADE